MDFCDIIVNIYPMLCSENMKKKIYGITFKYVVDYIILFAQTYHSGTNPTCVYDIAWSHAGISVSFCQWSNNNKEIIFREPTSNATMNWYLK